VILEKLGAGGAGGGPSNTQGSELTGGWGTGGSGAGAVEGQKIAGDNGTSGTLILYYDSALDPLTDLSSCTNTYVEGSWRVYEFFATGAVEI
jgi:hypothetical protein